MCEERVSSVWVNHLTQTHTRAHACKDIHIRTCTHTHTHTHTHMRTHICTRTQDRPMLDAEMRTLGGHHMPSRDDECDTIYEFMVSDSGTSCIRPACV